MAGIEQQQGRLAAGRGEIETNGSGAVASADFEPRLPCDGRDHLRLEFHVNQLVLSGLQYLHGEGTLYRSRTSRFGFIRSFDKCGLGFLTNNGRFVEARPGMPGPYG